MGVWGRLSGLDNRVWCACFRCMFVVGATANIPTYSALQVPTWVRCDDLKKNWFTCAELMFTFLPFLPF